MRKVEILKTLLTPILELTLIVSIFFLSYLLRSITDGIPFVQLRIPFISEEQFIPFVISGSVLWGLIFAMRGLYTIRPNTPLFEEIQLTLKGAFVWLIVYMSFVYLSTGFLFTKELPRLIIIYVYIFASFFSVLLRALLHNFFDILYGVGIVQKSHVAVLIKKGQKTFFTDDKRTTYITFELTGEKEELFQSIRERKIDTVLSFITDFGAKSIRQVIELARIYGIPFVYPKFLPELDNFGRKEGFIQDIPTIELTSISIGPWERVIKRCIDIFCSLLGLILLSPLFLLIALIIKIEDPSGPVLFANRRIGQNGKIFSLYKFRYMYWKYSVKDAYGVDNTEDDALKFEEKLKQESDSRHGPLYKIKNDPRKTRFGRILEKLSLDELPQLFNVLKGDMSLIGPRPHQPREVELYDEEDKQVLTVKPGITGMAQVYGREKNSFKEEVALDRRYIESYSPGLDLVIFLRTIIVVMTRALSWRGK